MLEVKGISKHYKNKQILNGITFAAGPGQCVGIAGGNGCGKNDASFYSGRCKQAGPGEASALMEWRQWETERYLREMPPMCLRKIL